MENQGSLRLVQLSVQIGPNRSNQFEPVQPWSMVRLVHCLLFRRFFLRAHAYKYQYEWRPLLCSKLHLIDLWTWPGLGPVLDRLQERCYKHRFALVLSNNATDKIITSRLQTDQLNTGSLLTQQPTSSRFQVDVWHTNTHSHTHSQTRRACHVWLVVIELMLCIKCVIGRRHTYRHSTVVGMPCNAIRVPAIRKWKRPEYASGFCFRRLPEGLLLLFRSIHSSWFLNIPSSWLDCIYEKNNQVDEILVELMKLQSNVTVQFVN